MSAERHGASEWQEAVMRLKCFLSVQEKDFSRSREEGNTVDFTPLFEMIFILMLKMEELRELAKGKKLDHFGTTSPAEMDEKVSSSHDPPWPLTQKIMTFPVHSGEPYACWWPLPAGQKADKASSLSDCRKHLEPPSFLHHLPPFHSESACLLPLSLDVLVWSSVQWHWTLPIYERGPRPTLWCPLLLHALCWMLYAERLFCPHLVL